MSAAREALDRASAKAEKLFGIGWCDVGELIHDFLSAYKSERRRDFWLEWAASRIAGFLRRELDERCGEKPGERGVPDHLRLDP